MVQKIKNMNDLAKALEPKVMEILDLVAEDVKREIDDALGKYYDEYDPVYYTKRTHQLRNCCKIGSVKMNGNNFSVEIYLDIDSLDYETEGADPYKTVVSSASGLHGGWNPSNISAGQVPWEQISSNDGSRHGSGTQIWEEPMHELIDNGKLIESFKRHAKARGLNIK